jgi:glutaredoxin
MTAEIYSTPACGQCVMAKNVLKSKEIPFTEYTVGKDVQKAELEERVGNPVRSVPQIFMDGNYLGSLPELTSFIKENGL